MNLFVVECAQGKLGFTYGGPKNRVNGVTPHSWAEAAGVLPGDLLLQINGMDASEYNAHEKRTMMKTLRPLKLQFVRSRYVDRSANLIK